MKMTMIMMMMMMMMMMLLDHGTHATTRDFIIVLSSGSLYLSSTQVRHTIL